MSCKLSQYKHDNFVGRPSGGLIIFWKVAENLTFIPKFFDNRIMDLKIIFSDNRSFLLLNVYMPCDYAIDISSIKLSFIS